MKLATDIRTVKADGVQASGVFAISMANQAHIMTILRDTLYSDKELAVLREYASNAWDAHRSVGKDNVPIQVQLPSFDEPVLVIRDFGPGLSEEDIFQVYTQYGESTKRDSNATVGFLGIGSKSGFGYSDSFTVTSWHGGFKSVYVAFLDSSDKGEINKIDSAPCGDETGIEIRIAVREKDIGTFHRKAENLFKFFEPRPDINLPLPEINRTVTPHGFIYDRGVSRDWTAIMGCVPYHLDVSQVETELEEAGLQDTVSHVFGGLYFDIGDVQVSASREELKYSDKTKAAIVQKFQQLIDVYVEDAISSLKDGSVSGWEKRNKILFLTQTLRLPIPKAYQNYTVREVQLYDAKTPPATFFLQTPEGRRVMSIPIGFRNNFYFRDDTRALKGFNISDHDILIAPLVPDPLDRTAIMAEFEALTKACELDGIPISDLSTVTWFNPNTNPNKRPPNRKHRVRTFRYLPGASIKGKKSDRWEIEEREPTDDDVFVIISEFTVTSEPNFFYTYRDDEKLAKALGLKMPTVYGYKTTAKKPLVTASCKGKPYGQWRVEFFKQAITQEHSEIYRLQDMARIVDGSFPSDLKDGLVWLTNTLGEAHPIVFILKQAAECVAALEAIPKDSLRLANDLDEFADPIESVSEQCLKFLFTTYPLLEKFRFDVLFEDSDPRWIDYIRLVDRDPLRVKTAPAPGGKETNDQTDLHLDV